MFDWPQCNLEGIAGDCSKDSEREKLHALNLTKKCYAMKMDMLTNATVVDDAIRFIAVNTNSNSEKIMKAKNQSIH